jgi:hypothetical protein
MGLLSVYHQNRSNIPSALLRAGVCHLAPLGLRGASTLCAKIKELLNRKIIENLLPFLYGQFK